MTKLRWHHTNDRVEVGVSINFTTKDVPIAAIETFPKSIANHNTFRKTFCLLFFRSEDATELRMCAEQAEVVRADSQQLNSFRPFGSGQIRVDRPDRRDAL